MPSTRRGLFLGLSGLAAAAAGLFGARARAARYYEGPVSDHFDGTVFRDPHGTPPKSFTELARWWSARGNGADWPDWAPSPHRDRPPARVVGARLRISFVGHASFLVQTGGHNILVDPV